MKTRPSMMDHSSSRHEAQSTPPIEDPRIDAVLRVYAHAEPAPGLESRVAARLAAGAQQQTRFHFSLAGASAGLILRRFSMGALATAAGLAIVVGTIRHSERTLLPPIARHGQGSGFVPAGASLTPTHAMPQGGSIDPAAPRVPPHGRAIVSRDQARRSNGAAVPRSPYAPNEQPADPASRQ